MEAAIQVEGSVIEDKILHTLSVYPRISPSMLQVGVGPSLSPVIWRPILDSLIMQGKVKREHIRRESPGGRTRTYEVLYTSVASH